MTLRVTTNLIIVFNFLNFYQAKTSAYKKKKLHARCLQFSKKYKNISENFK